MYRIERYPRGVTYTTGPVHELPAAARRFTYILHKLFKASMVFTDGKNYNVNRRKEHTISKENVT